MAISYEINFFSGSKSVYDVFFYSEVLGKIQGFFYITWIENMEV